MTTSDPEQRDFIPDEITEEEELKHQIAWYKNVITYHTAQLSHYEVLLVGTECSLKLVQAESKAFLKDYCPGCIGDDPADQIAKEDVEKIDKEFICPECGSNHFGTWNCTEDYDKWMGHCHGYIGNRACTYTWKRSEEDKNVFIAKEET